MLMRKQIRLNDGRFCLPSNEIVWLSLEMPTSQYKLLGSNVSFGVPPSHNNLFDDSVWKLKHLKLNQLVTLFLDNPVCEINKYLLCLLFPNFSTQNSKVEVIFFDPSVNLHNWGRWLVRAGDGKCAHLGINLKKAVTQCGQFHFLFSSKNDIVVMLFVDRPPRALTGLAWLREVSPHQSFQLCMESLIPPTLIRSIQIQIHKCNTAG